ncbi:MAG: hypothetical protein Q4A58_04870 [Fusobacterium sp.]|uniref:hypothetical protein n=1 Tax=Fusobacterium sp. TaxID=68766 RepID=UPI0026DB140B|nr:hypothetical protein [Fusobacterium sp.]MDO4690609.1 hypothetical protein [Fusobacterium sp.]
MLFALVSVHFAAVIIAVIVNYFLSQFLSIIIALIVYIIMMYIVIFSENIKFIVDEDKKTLQYFENGKLMKEYNLVGAKLGYNITTKRNQGATKIDLQIDNDVIHCEPLGQMKFNMMYAQLESLAEVEPIKLKVSNIEK